MTATIGKTTRTMLWPDGQLDVPEELLRELGIEGGWQCTIEIADGALVVRPRAAIPDEDLWAYEPETHARLKQAMSRPVEESLHLSEEDLMDLVAGKTTIEELIS